MRSTSSPRSGRSSSAANAPAAMNAPASRNAPPDAKSLAMTSGIRLPRGLQIIRDELFGDLAAHRVADLQRIAEMDSAPHSHLPLFLGELPDPIEFSRYAGAANARNPY